MSRFIQILKTLLRLYYDLLKFIQPMLGEMNSGSLLMSLSKVTLGLIWTSLELIQAFCGDLSSQTHIFV